VEKKQVVMIQEGTKGEVKTEDWTVLLRWAFLLSENEPVWGEVEKKEARAEMTDR
jgi:hypothetical protein